jgi:sugar phosphate isomerase/epimerase
MKLSSTASNHSSRRKFLIQSGALTAGLGLIPYFGFGDDNVAKKSTMGVAGSSYAIRWRSGDASKKIPGFENALQMLRHCESIGAGGIQVGSRDWSQDFSGQVRDFRESKELYLEGSIQLPQNDQDLDRFIVETKSAMEAGAQVLRTACLSGRRYENFETGQAFEEFKQNAIKSIERAIPVLEKYQLKLAIENHKDWTVIDLLLLLKHFDHELVGVNLDTGNNISFLENPMYVIESLAPYSFTTHLKDMGIKNYEDGFLLSEVPLGAGQLDLKQIVAICLEHNTQIKFNLEMITRNPLKVPYHEDRYWQTFENLSAKNAIAGISWVRDHQSKQDLPSVEGMTQYEKLVFEEKNIVESFSYATKELELVK